MGFGDHVFVCHGRRLEEPPAFSLMVAPSNVAARAREVDKHADVRHEGQHRRAKNHQALACCSRQQGGPAERDDRLRQPRLGRQPGDARGPRVRRDASRPGRPGRRQLCRSGAQAHGRHKAFGAETQTRATQANDDGRSVTKSARVRRDSRSRGHGTEDNIDEANRWPSAQARHSGRPQAHRGEPRQATGAQQTTFHEGREGYHGPPRAPAAPPPQPPPPPPPSPPSPLRSRSTVEGGQRRGTSNQQGNKIYSKDGTKMGTFSSASARQTGTSATAPASASPPRPRPRLYLNRHPRLRPRSRSRLRPDRHPLTSTLI